MKTLNRRLGILRQNAGAEKRKRRISLAKLSRIRAQRTRVRFYNRKISARDGSGPGRPRPGPLEIIEHLAHQGKGCLSGAAPREPGVHQDARGGLHQPETMPRDKRSRGVIRDLVLRIDRYRHATQRSRDLLSHAPGRWSAFDGEDHVLQLRHFPAREGLHRMHRASRRAKMRERSQSALVERPAGVQHDFAAASGASGPGKSGGDAGDGIIRRRNKNNVRIDRIERYAAMRRACADPADRRTRVRIRPRDDRADSPAEPMETSAQCFSRASCADDGNRACHAAC